MSHSSTLSMLALAALIPACANGAEDQRGVVDNGVGGTIDTGSGGSIVTGSGGSVTILADGAVVSTGDAGTDPTTCADAAGAHSYVGCDFWPTIVANPVWLEFKPAVVVANGGGTEATVTVDGPAAFHQQVKIAAGQLSTIMLEWVADLKGPEFSVANTSGGRLNSSASVPKGAYHLTSTVPVTVWQFNPLNYQIPKADCTRQTITGPQEYCRSASVDASLLLPSTAMTGNYRVFAYSQWNEGDLWGSVPGGFAITATQDATTVKVQLGNKCGVELYPTKDLGACTYAAPQGGGLVETKANQVLTLTMNAGDVAQLVGEWSGSPQVWNADVSGSIINASAPVQVVSFNAIAQVPDATVANADHMEETVLPAEVLGKKYIVVPPTTPNGNAVGHVVRIYGNVDGTNLTYPEGKPDPSAPDKINAGDMFQIAPQVRGSSCQTAPAKCMTNTPFIVEGDQPFAVMSFMLGGTLQMPGTDATTSQGDPAMSMEVTPEQFRQSYTFLAPTDYLENFADVLIPQGASVILDGKALADAPTQIGKSEWGFVRAKLGAGAGGVHTISTPDERGLGLQVEGFGYATSYYYPGGLNLKLISEPPVINIK
jgi:hypothetical protein